MTKVACICLGAYAIKSWTKEQNFDRQSVYSIALSQALRISEDSTTKEKDISLDFFIVENTIEKEEEIIEELRSQLNHERIQDVQLINNNGVGSKNKGAGEYMMCRAVIEKHKDSLMKYDWIIYYTLRQIIISPLILTAIADIEHNENKKDVSVIVGNPDYLYLDGKRVHSAPGNYCDMIFAMRPTQFFDYIDSMTPEELVAKKLSSEMNLYSFINDKKENITPLELERLGVMRHNYAINTTEIV